MAEVRDFTSKVLESSKELTARERIKMKDTTEARKIDELTQIEPLQIRVVDWVVLSIHNGKLEKPDYNNYVLIDDDGNKYVTGSESFWSSYIEIYREMEEENEPYEVKIYRVPSKNYNGKDFITCSIV